MSLDKIMWMIDWDKVPPSIREPNDAIGRRSTDRIMLSDHGNARTYSVSPELIADLYHTEPIYVFPGPDYQLSDFASLEDIICPPDPIPKYAPKYTPVSSSADRDPFFTPGEPVPHQLRGFDTRILHHSALHRLLIQNWISPPLSAVLEPYDHTLADEQKIKYELRDGGIIITRAGLTIGVIKPQPNAGLSYNGLVALGQHKAMHINPTFYHLKEPNSCNFQGRADFNQIEFNDIYHMVQLNQHLQTIAENSDPDTQDALVQFFNAVYRSDDQSMKGNLASIFEISSKKVHYDGLPPDVIDNFSKIAKIASLTGTQRFAQVLPVIYANLVSTKDLEATHSALQHIIEAGDHYTDLWSVYIETLRSDLTRPASTNCFVANAAAQLASTDPDLAIDFMHFSKLYKDQILNEAPIACTPATKQEMEKYFDCFNDQRLVIASHRKHGHNIAAIYDKTEDKDLLHRAADVFEPYFFPEDKDNTLYNLLFVNLNQIISKNGKSEDGQRFLDIIDSDDFREFYTLYQGSDEAQTTLLSHLRLASYAQDPDTHIQDFFDIAFDPIVYQELTRHYTPENNQILYTLADIIVLYNQSDKATTFSAVDAFYRQGCEIEGLGPKSHTLKALNTVAQEHPDKIDPILSALHSDEYLALIKRFGIQETGRLYASLIAGSCTHDDFAPGYLAMFDDEKVIEFMTSLPDQLDARAKDYIFLSKSKRKTSRIEHVAKLYADLGNLESLQYCLEKFGTFWTANPSASIGRLLDTATNITEKSGNVISFLDGINDPRYQSVFQEREQYTSIVNLAENPRDVETYLSVLDTAHDDLKIVIDKKISTNHEYLSLVHALSGEIALSKDPKIKARLEQLLEGSNELTARTEFIQQVGTDPDLEFENTYEKLDYMALGCKIIRMHATDYMNAFRAGGLEALTTTLNNEIRKKLDIAEIDSDLPRYTSLGFINAAIKVLDESDNNVKFLLKQAYLKGSVKEFLESDGNAQNTYKALKEHGYDTDFFVASGDVILERAGRGGEIGRWEDAYKSIVRTVLGSKDSQPKVNIPKLSRKKAYHQIKGDYHKGLAGDDESAKRVLAFLTEKIDAIKDTKQYNRSLEELHDNISGVLGQIDHGIRSRGGKVTAKIGERMVPEVFYDHERLRCCIFKPRGASSGEIPLFVMDPQTTMVEYWMEGFDEFMGVATLYAGQDRKILMDTWEANSMIYSVLGSNHMKKFALDSMVLAADKAITGRNPKQLLVYDCGYGKPLEFVNYVRELSKTSDAIKYDENAKFTAADAWDLALTNSKTHRKHHYTDAFGHDSAIEGRLKAYVVDIDKYKQEMMEGKDESTDS
ncbi:hypothetical protein ACFL0V_01320 [Nanoarchaeota archaeon]